MLGLTRKQKHLQYMYEAIYKLNREIYNTALEGKIVDKNILKLYKKYNRRLKLLEF